jgi:NAD+ kinase
MTARLKNILIVAKTGHAEALRLGAEIASWLDSRGVTSEVMENCRPLTDLPCLSMEPAAGFSPPDLILVLGGDGTLLSVARRALSLKVPLLGLNLGNLGFLTCGTPDDWQAFLAGILEGQGRVHERMALACRVERQGKSVRSGVAVNDFVVSRGAMARLIHLKLWYGQERVMDVHADGLIVSSPTGSTAYVVSAGGPVVHPDLQAYVVAAICPFMGHLKSLVLPPNQPLAVDVQPQGSEIYLTEDGQNVFALEPGDRLVIEPAPQGPLLLSPDGHGWFQALREKGFAQG